MTLLTDDSPMPFGKHKGVPMMKVPASYLHWWWTKADSTSHPQVAAYIEKNLKSLEKEHSDGIW